MTVATAIEDLINGSDLAFTFLFRKYSDEVCNFIYRFTRNRETARELTQDVFMKVWLHHASIDSSQSFEAYLFTIARNHLFNFLKRRLKEQEILQQMPAMETDEDPYELETYREVMSLYTHSLENLPPRQREVFVMNREEGLTYKQIAAQLNISVSAVEKHMSAALRTMKNNINPTSLATCLFIAAFC